MIPLQRARFLKPFLLLLALLATAGCSTLEAPTEPGPAPKMKAGYLFGYLAPGSLPDGRAFVPPPPAMDSVAFELDREISRKALTLQGSEHWKLAAADADLDFPPAAETFSCALDAPISEKETPHLYRLLHRTLTDAGLSTYTAKKKYRRKRPFMINGKPNCTPDYTERLEKDGSYPSGHAAIGWAWALILSEVAPQRSDALLARGRAFGQSRVICNVHWQSDVIQGRYLGAATVARLHADAGFRKALAAARREVASARARELSPQRDCKAEARALKLVPPGAPWPANR
ncbi:MAG: acid phosphatase [Gammaproteobacteria bacterium]|nr:MAG: acid phosphatase [Gammaproteobacteria bacterium]